MKSSCGGCTRGEPSPLASAAPQLKSILLSSVRANWTMAQNYRDLGEFITFLEGRGELRRVTAPVTWDLEITEITQRVLREGGPALLFENVEGYEGAPALINLYGTEQRVAWALGVESLDELPASIEKMMAMAQGGPPEGLMGKLRMLGDLVKLGRIGPRRVDREDAPAQEVVMEGDDGRSPLAAYPQDLAAGRRPLHHPAPRHHERPPTPASTTLACTGCRSTTGTQPACTGRRTRLGTQHERASAERGAERMEVAVALGGDPTLIWAGSAPLPADVSEYVLAGFLRGTPVPVVKGVTVDLDVPANAEYILEGYVDPAERRPEGPFGDHTGYYSIQDEYPVFHVTAITRRRKPHLPHHRRGAPAAGGLLDGRRDGAPVPPLDAVDAAGDRGRAHARRGRLPQPRARLNQEGVPRPRAEDGERHVGASA